MKPFFSIITVTKNCAQDAGLTAASVRAQRDIVLEHIVKDGGSTDDTRNSVIDANPDAKYISSKDTGIFDAMNQALEHASGEYVLFLNAGDCLISPNTLADVRRSIIESGLPDLIYGDYSTSPSNIKYCSPHKLGKFTLFRNTICHQSSFFKLNCYKNIGCFDTAYRVQGDYDFLLRAIVDNLCSYIYIPFVIISSKEGGFSSQNLSCALVEADLVRRRHYSALYYYTYKCLLWISMQGLRRRLSKSKLFKKAYARMVNVYNSNLK